MTLSSAPFSKAFIFRHHFSPIHPWNETERFQKAPLLKLRFHQPFRWFSVDDKQKRIRNYAFSYKNALVLPANRSHFSHYLILMFDVLILGSLCTSTLYLDDLRGKAVAVRRFFYFKCGNEPVNFHLSINPSMGDYTRCRNIILDLGRVIFSHLPLFPHTRSSALVVPSVGQQGSLSNDDDDAEDDAK